MKKIFSFILLLASFVSYSQLVVNRSGQANTVIDARLGAKFNFFLPRFADTTAANLQKGIDTCGALISTYDNKLWKRDCGPKVWVEVGTGGSGGGITSVALSMPTAFTVTGSPITTSGTFAVTGAGTTSQYIRGNGTLATFPTNLSSFTNGPGYITNSDLSPYLTSTTAATTYVPLTRTINTQPLSSNLVLTTDNIGEGSTNLYHTLARARAAISLSLTTTGSGAATGNYNNSTGVLTLNIPIPAGTSYSFSSPLSVTGGVVSIQVANTSQSGYLSSTDWNTFNNKANASHTHAATDITQNSTHRFVTDAEKAYWNSGSGGDADSLGGFPASDYVKADSMINIDLSGIRDGDYLKYDSLSNYFYAVRPDTVVAATIQPTGKNFWFNPSDTTLNLAYGGSVFKFYSASSGPGGGGSLYSHESPFTASNGTALTSYTPLAGNPWIHASGTWQIQSNRAVPATLTGSNAAIALTDAGTTTQTLIVVMSIGSTGGAGGQIVVRSNSTATDGIVINVTPTNIEMYNGVASSFTKIGSTVITGTNSSDHTYEVTVSGSTITVLQDGSSIYSSQPLPTTQTGTYCGMSQFGTASIIASFNSFIIE